MLGLANEICILDLQNSSISSVFPRQLPNTPRPLLIGVSVADTGPSLVIIGGSAVCFSFGTFWNKGCYTMSMLESKCGRRDDAGVLKAPVVPWHFLCSVAATPRTVSSRESPLTSIPGRQPVVVSRVQLASAEHFDRLLQAAQPVILEQSDIGFCSSKWTTEYLKEKVGSEREVNISKVFHISESSY
jgi:tRNA wybutosine-synthesizing protein 4